MHGCAIEAPFREFCTFEQKKDLTMPMYKEWNHDLADFGLGGQDHQKIQTFFLIFCCRPQTLPPRNATQGKISSGSDFILEPCDSQSHGWLGWAEMAGGGNSAQKNEHLIVS